MKNVPKFSFSALSAFLALFFALSVGAQPSAVDTPLTIGAADVTLGAEARLRWEHWENFGFVETNDDDFLLARFRVFADAVFSENGPRIHLEGKSSTSTTRDLPGGKRTLDEDTLALQEAWVGLPGTIADAKVELRLGRQALSYGKQRLVSPLDWSNTRRTWDGARTVFTQDKWTVDAIFTWFVPVEQKEFNDPDGDDIFYGLYANHKLMEEMNYDLYWLARSRDDSDIFTTGTRVGGNVGETGLDYDVEGALQYGENGDADVEAWFGAAEVGYVLPFCPFASRVALGYDIASGDDDPDDDKVGTFDQLFPLGHAYLGFIDAVGRRNVQDFSQHLKTWVVKKKVLVKVDHHIFDRENTSDALYNAGGGVLRAADTGTSRDIGSELDLTVKWMVTPEAALVVGYSKFFAGTFIEQGENSEDIEFFYTSVAYNF